MKYLHLLLTLMGSEKNWQHCLERKKRPNVNALNKVEVYSTLCICEWNQCYHMKECEISYRMGTFLTTLSPLEMKCISMKKVYPYEYSGHERVKWKPMCNVLHIFTISSYMLAWMKNTIQMCKKLHTSELPFANH